MAELPGCLGYWHSLKHGPCAVCGHREVCKHIAKNFVPKTKLEPIIAQLGEMLEKCLRT